MVDRWIVESTLSEVWDFYTRANVGEVFPDPVAPLTSSFAFMTGDGLGGAELGFRDAFVRMGAFEHEELPPKDMLFLGVAGGYCYLNASAMRLFGHRAPGMTAADIDLSFFGGTSGVPDFVVKPGFDRPELTERIGATFGWVLTADGLPEVAEDERLVNALRSARPDASTLEDRALIERVWQHFDAHFRHLFGQHIYITFLATLPLGIITAVCNAVGRPEATLRLVAGVGDVESAAPSMALWDLGRMVAASPSLGAEFDRGAPGLDGRLRSSADADAVAFVVAFDEFLYRYGSRGPNEWELRSPTWETEPDLALAAVERMRLSPESSSPHRHNRDRAVEREALGGEIAALLAGDPEAQGQFLAALRAATVFLPGRERTKTNNVKLIEENRILLREWGRRMVERGHFPRVESFGLLTRAEIAEVLDDPSGWHDVLVEREALYDEVRQLQEPFLFVASPPPMGTYPRRDAVVVEPSGTGTELVGMAGCPGRAVGRARIVLDSHDPGALEPGDVLVAPITDPSWTPLFVPAGAVVVDVGAPLSHAIIVSRELGIPCVVSVTDATRRIPDGALVEVDGDSGTVRILEL
ncbi:MAG: phosphoenolpyruvate-utilizing protein [Acidimicrobiales bacterium]|nr:phosphoenolpyruvate-utilizing protein [Acidimicrobiales bacterium]